MGKVGKEKSKYVSWVSNIDKKWANKKKKMGKKVRKTREKLVNLSPCGAEGSVLGKVTDPRHA